MQGANGDPGLPGETGDPGQTGLPGKPVCHFIIMNQQLWCVCRNKERFSVDNLTLILPISGHKESSLVSMQIPTDIDITSYGVCVHVYKFCTLNLYI